jgi:hypothetical protein
MVITKDVHFCSELVKSRCRNRMKPAAWLNVLKMSIIEHLLTCGTLHYVVVKTKELTPAQILSVPCPTCGAAPEEACELHTGALRTEPHRDRKLSAAEAVETKRGKREQSVRRGGTLLRRQIIPHSLLR